MKIINLIHQPDMTDRAPTAILACVNSISPFLKEDARRLETEA